MRPASNVVTAAVTIAVIAAVGATAIDSSRAAGVLLTVAQTAAIAALIAHGLGGRAEGWANASCVLGAAWVGLFLGPSWVYAVDPVRLRAPVSATAGLALLALSAFALLLGAVIGQRGLRRGDPTDSAGPSPRTDGSTRWALAGWCAVSAIALTVLFVRAGGPIAYLTNLDETGESTAGLMYVIWGVLAIKYAAIANLALRWSRGDGARRRDLLFVAGACAVIALMGARAFLAIGLAQLLLLFAVLRHPMPWWRIAPAIAVAGVVLVFGLGAVKRYQAHEGRHPGTGGSFASYLVRIAPAEAVDTYVSNYADGARALVVARAVVPEQAEWERGKALLRLILQPIPSPLRPKVVDTAEPIRVALQPDPLFPPALPLQVTSYLQFGALAVACVFLLLGVVCAAIDRGLRGSHSTPAVLMLVALCSTLPMVVRSGVPAGVVISALDVVGFGAVGWTMVRRRRFRPRALGSQGWPFRRRQASSEHKDLVVTTPSSET